MVLRAAGPFSILHAGTRPSAEPVHTDHRSLSCWPSAIRADPFYTRYDSTQFRSCGRIPGANPIVTYVVKSLCDGLRSFTHRLRRARLGSPDLVPTKRPVHPVSEL